MFTIMVIDDDKRIRRYLESFLSRAGFNVLVAEGGADALAQLELATADLVVTDILMPGVNGVQLSQAIRDIYPDIPVMAMSGSDVGIVNAMAHGADRMIQKPFVPKEMLSTIEDLLPQQPRFASYL